MEPYGQQRMNTPIITSNCRSTFSEFAAGIDGSYDGFRLRKEASVDIAVHLDHGLTLET